MEAFIDQALIGRSLENLVQNAMQVVPEDGGIVQVSLVEDGGYVNIVVEDNGPEDPRSKTICLKLMCQLARVVRVSD